MKSQGDLVARALQALQDWMPKVDKSIETLQLSIDHVDARVKVLETEQPAGATTTPKANGHSSA